jgi:hypothetical protein
VPENNRGVTGAGNPVRAVESPGMTAPTPAADTPPLPTYEGYCFRCKTRKNIKNATESRMKNGKPVVTGICNTCGTKIFKILARNENNY